MENFTDDTVIAVASFLSPHDMLSLALTCKRFGAKHGKMATKQPDDKGESSREVRQKTEALSLMEVAARTAFHASATKDEKNALPRRGDESWFTLYQEFLKLFRLPLQFDKMAGECFDYVEGSNKTKVCTNGGYMSHNTAICSNIMRAGKHSVSFQFQLSMDEEQRWNDRIIHASRAAIPGHPSRKDLAVGIMRPTTKDITSEKYEALDTCDPTGEDLSRFSLKQYEGDVDCCMLNAKVGEGLRARWEDTDNDGYVLKPSDRHDSFYAGEDQQFDWEGMEGSLGEESFKIGMVLDLDEGTLDVYKNDRRLGTMMSGLSGEYCWAFTRISGKERLSVTIGR